MNQKDELRAEAKQWRSMLSRQEVMHVSRNVTNQLEALDWLEVRTVHIYLPIEKNNEIDTSNFIYWLWSSHPEIAVYTPVYDRSRDKMTYLRYTKNSTITPDEMGIPTVQDGLELGMDIEFDRIIIPTMLTDQSRNRIGYGMGIYDRFLAGQPKAEKIGLGFKSLQKPTLPTEAHDVPLDLVLLG